MSQAAYHQFLVTEDRVHFHVVHMRFAMDKNTTGESISPSSCLLPYQLSFHQCFMFVCQQRLTQYAHLLLQYHGTHSFTSYSSN